MEGVTNHNKSSPVKLCLLYSAFEFVTEGLYKVSLVECSSMRGPITSCIDGHTAIAIEYFCRIDYVELGSCFSYIRLATSSGCTTSLCYNVVVYSRYCFQTRTFVV